MNVILFCFKVFYCEIILSYVCVYIPVYSYNMSCFVLETKYLLRAELLLILFTVNVDAFMDC